MVGKIEELEWMLEERECRIYIAPKMCERTEDGRELHGWYRLLAAKWSW